MDSWWTLWDDSLTAGPWIIVQRNRFGRDASTYFSIRVSGIWEWEDIWAWAVQKMQLCSSAGIVYGLCHNIESLPLACFIDCKTTAHNNRFLERMTTLVVTIWWQAASVSHCSDLSPCLLRLAGTWGNFKAVVLNWWVTTHFWVAEPFSVGRGPLPGGGNAKNKQKTECQSFSSTVGGDNTL